MPVTAPVIDNAAVVVSRNRIAAIGKWPEVRRSFRGRVIDLGDAAVLPGLVNAHCHLDYTNMAGHLAPVKLFTDWLKLITELKAGWHREDYQRSWLNGAGMLLRTGTTTVGDIEALPDLLPAVWRAMPLRIFSFLEIIGITGRRPPATLVREAREKIRSLRRNPKRQAGLSPHAPYSTVPELLCQCAALVRRHRWRLCMHVGESEVEHQMFTRAQGPMHDWMQRSGRDMSDCGKGSPLRHAAACGVLNDRFLAIHVNYLGRGDLSLLSKSGAHVVHCPRSHAYFKHQRFPLKSLLDHGVNVCLGTDSLASVLKRRSETVELNMFEEMRSLLRANPDVSPRTALRMATVSGAKALAMEHQVGELAPHAFADLIAVPLREGGDTMDSVMHHTGPVTASMIDGAWALPPQYGTEPKHRG